ncbi:hypothetical protein [[Kitasatospora] papulosa]|uniref:hypothetical protein n=1 Tax=[Kitasatospora] papulosa TaxID=1464011 RepID=UPI00367B7C68
MSEGIFAAVLIVAIVVGAACYAIRHLSKTVGRVSVVIASLAVLVGALVPVIKILVEPPAPGAGGQVVAPAVPATSNQDLPQSGTSLSGGTR